MTNEHQILFKAEMIRAILDGRKTKTRRVVKRDYMVRHPDPYPYYIRRRDAIWDSFKTLDKLVEKHCPYGKPGDLLWVRETWSAATHWNTKKPSELIDDLQIWYKADGSRRYDVEGDWQRGKWRAPIHMPKWACRLWLEVTGVRVERVQDIDPSDIWDEGIAYRGPGDHLAILSAYEDFSSLWDRINAKRSYSWESNPWVWVIGFGIKEIRGN